METAASLPQVSDTKFIGFFNREVKSNQRFEAEEVQIAVSN
jgi:hypothetical protein